MDAFVRLLVAGGLTAFIGLDRELRSKPAGLRTNIVVGIASAAFAFAGRELFVGGDPTRVASQIVSGIGFLGAGAIFAAGGKPHGLTTAAALWGAAAVGLVSGLGEFRVAVAVTAVTLITLWPLDWAIERLLRRFARRHLAVHLIVRNLDALEDVQRQVGGSQVRLLDVEVQSLEGQLLVDLTVNARGPEIDALLTGFSQRADVVLLAHGVER